MGKLWDAIFKNEMLKYKRQERKSYRWADADEKERKLHRKAEKNEWWCQCCTEALY